MEETHFFNITYRRKSVPKVARRHANRGLTYATTQKLLLPSEPTGRATHLRTRRSRTCSLTLSKNQNLPMTIRTCSLPAHILQPILRSTKMTEIYIGCTTGGKKKEPRAKQTVLQRWRVLHRQGLIAFTQGNTAKGIKFLGTTSTRPIPLYNAKNTLLLQYGC